MTRAFAFTLVLTLPVMACGHSPPSLDDPAKQARIAAMYDEYRADFPGAPEMTVEELLERRGAVEVVIVDAREKSEQEVSMIPGALPREEFEARAEEFRGVPVVSYCTIGYRSGLFTEELRQRGFEAYNLVGSVLAWTHAGQPLEDPAGEETRRVHVYGKKWALAAAGYEEVW